MGQHGGGSPLLLLRMVQCDGKVEDKLLAQHVLHTPCEDPPRLPCIRDVPRRPVPDGMCDGHRLTSFSSDMHMLLDAHGEKEEAVVSLKDPRPAVKEEPTGEEVSVGGQKAFGDIDHDGEKPVIKHILTHVFIGCKIFFTLRAFFSSSSANGM